MVQLTKFGIQNFGEFGNNIEIDFNKITLISNQFPITLVKNMILSFFDTDVIMDKIELEKYIIKDKPLIISLPFSFLYKENLILKYQYDNDGELSSFKIIDKEKMVAKTSNRKRIEKEEAIVELTKKGIFIDFILLQEWYYAANIGFKEKKDYQGHLFELTDSVKYSVTFSTISSLKEQIKNYMKQAGTILDNRIYDNLRGYIKLIEQIFGNIKTISAANLNEIERIGLNNDEIPFIDIAYDEIVSLQNNRLLKNWSKIAKIANIVSDFSKTYSERNIIIYTDEVVIDELKNELVKCNLSDKDINLYKVIQNSTSLVLCPDEQTKLKSENIELRKEIDSLGEKLKVSDNDVRKYIDSLNKVKKSNKEKIEELTEKHKSSSKKQYKTLTEKVSSSNNALKLSTQKVNKFETQLSIETYNEKKLLKEMGLSKQSITLSEKISPTTIQYLSSAEYLMANMSDNPDYSPVILQYGKAVESELMNFFDKFNKYLIEQKSGLVILFKDFVSDFNLKNLKELKINLLVDKEGENKDKIKKEFTTTKNIEKGLSFFQCQFILIIHSLKDKNDENNKKIQATNLFVSLNEFVKSSKFSIEKLKDVGFIQLGTKQSTINAIRFQRNGAAHAGEILNFDDAKDMKDKTFEFFKKWISAKN